MENSSKFKKNVIFGFSCFLRIIAEAFFTDLLTYSAITNSYRSWPQLICDAVAHEQFQLGANFGYSALQHSQTPV